MGTRQVRNQPAAPERLAAGGRLTLRAARPEDSSLLWSWRNDPVTRAMSFQTGLVPWEAHQDWFSRSLSNPARVIWVVEEAGQPVATVRLDRIGDGRAEISINVAPGARGRGIGSAALRLAGDRAAAGLGYHEIIARIRTTNTASIRAFRQAGFEVAATAPDELSMVRRRPAAQGGPGRWPGAQGGPGPSGAAAPLRVLVVGCGSIGRRHLRLLGELGVAAEGCEPDPDRRAAAARDPGVPVHADLDDALARGFDGAVIATPTHLHLEPAHRALAAGCGILVEKPLSRNLDGVDRLLRAVAEARRPLLVGYALRFHPGLRRVKELLDAGAVGTVRSARVQFGQYLPDWRPGQDYRRSYSALSAMGGGIILDASHELDYVCWLLGEPERLSCLAGRVSPLEIETEDVAEILLRFRGGTIASVHLDYLNRAYSRGCELIGDQGTVAWSYPEQAVRVFRPGHGWSEERIPFVADDMYRAELEHFLACLRGDAEPLIPGRDGQLALYLALAAHRSAAAGAALDLFPEVLA